MTCHNALALLEDYVDGELSAELEARVREHLAGCRRCRLEFEWSSVLKELLKQKKAPDPDRDRWAETTNLIYARTVEQDTNRYRIMSVAERNSAQRGAFVRSVVSVAASLAILFSAILLGSGSQQQLARVSASESPIFVAAPLEDQVTSDNITVASDEENLRRAKGMLLLGPPGSLGRFISPFDFARAIN
ncbi:MAG: zf-HC2 domain-containing protein [Candidatus Zixiibacteriota bacterium]|nr:MAG: zf-HC2 domain-containing protein [candidate division Zixibacteria bacterium]